VCKATEENAMAHLPDPTDDQLEPAAKGVLDSFQTAYGRPSHIFRAMSWNPRFVRTASEAWHRLVVEPSSLSRWVKEAVVVITCSAQHTPYCVEGHSHALRRERLDERQIKAIQTHSFEGFSDPELSIFRFAHKAAANPKSLGAEDYQRLQALGLANTTILEILGVVWANTAMNMIVDALGVMRTPQQKQELWID
jgi:uncharacterized peroxidase-related enzyme